MLCYEYYVIRSGIDGKYSKKRDYLLDHGPSQSGPYSRVRDLLATFTQGFSSYC